MRRFKTEPVGDLLTLALQELHMDLPLRQSRAVKAWSSVLGSSIEQVTERIYFRQGGILVVKIRSSVVRNELQMSKPRIVARLNEAAGQQTVNDIIIQ